VVKEDTDNRAEWWQVVKEDADNRDKWCQVVKTMLIGNLANSIKGEEIGS